MRGTKVVKSIRGSINRSMREPFVASNKLAYSGHQELPIAPDVITSGTPALREALSDPELRDLRVLRGSIFYPCNPPARHHARHASPPGIARLQPRRTGKARRAGAFGEDKPVPKKIIGIKR